MPAHECNFCHKTDPRPKQCVGCKKAWYCGKECQQSDWVRHIFDCNPSRPVTTADYLALAANQRRLPEHPQTRADYGFSRTMQPDILLGLYICLLLPGVLCVKPHTLHKWRLRGTLVENIKKKFGGVQEASRGMYYSWFLRNEHVVSGIGAEGRVESEADEWVRRSWRFIGRSPTASVEDIRRHLKSASQSENECYLLYTMVLSNSHPGPELDQWMYFGFCACESHEAEKILSQSYIKLINRCTFDQFVNAYTSHSLISLFKGNGINITDPLIIDVLSGVLGGLRGNKSVWDLKRHIELKTIHGPEDTTVHPVPSVGADYGFYNCRTSEEHKLLFDLYKGFFALSGNTDPLQLHQACIQGRLFAYLAQDLAFKIKPRKTYERLLKNPYPLPSL